MSFEWFDFFWLTFEPDPRPCRRTCARALELGFWLTDSSHNKIFKPSLVKDVVCKLARPTWPWPKTMTTSQDKAVIRPYVHENEENKLVRFTIGKAAMEPLALGNIKRNSFLIQFVLLGLSKSISRLIVSIHPITIAIWLAVSSACIQLLNWWPDPKIGILGYFRPLSILAAAFLPFVFFFDWYVALNWVGYTYVLTKLVFGV